MQVENLNVMPSPGSVEERVRSFVSKQFGIKFGANVNDRTDLFEEGFIDSFGFVVLIKALETDFKIRFTDEELFSYRLNTNENIIDSVSKKLGPAG